jgi:hypothetical protein
VLSRRHAPLPETVACALSSLAVTCTRARQLPSRAADALRTHLVEIAALHQAALRRVAVDLDAVLLVLLPRLAHVRLLRLLLLVELLDCHRRLRRAIASAEALAHVRALAFEMQRRPSALSRLPVLPRRQAVCHVLRGADPLSASCAPAQALRTTLERLVVDTAEGPARRLQLHLSCSAHSHSVWRPTSCPQTPPVRPPGPS